MKKYIYLIALTAAMVLLNGCATNAEVGQMIMNTPVKSKRLVSKNLKHNITVGEVGGGHETNPMWYPEINNAGFKEALAESLIQAQLYNNQDKAAYKLTANLLELKQPFMGMNMTVTCVVRYKLINVKTGKMIYNRKISAAYTAKFADNLVGIMRLKDANEGAARENITKFINGLYKLNIKGKVGLH
jgi:hypothetical protein